MAFKPNYNQQRAERPLDVKTQAAIFVQLSGDKRLARGEVGHVDGLTGVGHQRRAKKILRDVRRIHLPNRRIAVVQMDPVDFHRLDRRISPPRRVERNQGS